MSLVVQFPSAIEREATAFSAMVKHLAPEAVAASLPDKMVALLRCRDRLAANQARNLLVCAGFEDANHLAIWYDNIVDAIAIEDDEIDRSLGLITYEFVVLLMPASRSQYPGLLSDLMLQVDDANATLVSNVVSMAANMAQNGACKGALVSAPNVIAKLLQVVASRAANSSDAAKEASLRTIALLCSNKDAAAQAAVLAANGVAVLTQLAVDRLPYPSSARGSGAAASNANANAASYAKQAMYAFWAMSQLCTANPQAMDEMVRVRVAPSPPSPIGSSSFSTSSSSLKSATAPAGYISTIDVLLEALADEHAANIGDYALATLLQLSINAEARHAMATHALERGGASDRGLQLLLAQLSRDQDSLLQRSLKILSNLCVGDQEREALTASADVMRTFVSLLSRAPTASELAMNLVRLLNNMLVCERDFDMLYQVAPAPHEEEAGSGSASSSSASELQQPGFIKVLLSFLSLDPSSSQFQPFIQQHGMSLLANLVSHGTSSLTTTTTERVRECVRGYALLC